MDMRFVNHEEIIRIKEVGKLLDRADYEDAIELSHLLDEFTKEVQYTMNLLDLIYLMRSNQESDQN